MNTRIRGRVLSISLLAGLAGVSLIAPAVASWGLIGSGTATARATALPSVSGASAVNATTTSIDLAWTAPTNPAPTGYTITRDGLTIACNFGAGSLGTAKCRDTFSSSAAATTYTYAVVPTLGAWKADSVSFSGTSVGTSAPLVITLGTGTSRSRSGSWTATVPVAVTDGVAGRNEVVVSGTWSWTVNGTSSTATASCTTVKAGNTNGTCEVTQTLPLGASSARFTVDSAVAPAGYVYTAPNPKTSAVVNQP